MTQASDLTDPQISRLAREVAREIRDLPVILAMFNLNAEQFEKVIDTKYFQVRLREETLLWTATDAMSVAERIKVKSSTLVEDCLLEVYQLVHDKNEPMSAKIEALKWAARMAGIGQENQSRGAGEDSQVKITINIGDKHLDFEKEKKLPARVIDGEVVNLTKSDA
jgi:hypothetical protein